MSGEKRVKFQYTPTQLTNAIAAVKSGSKIAIAARQFGVPRQTLSQKCRKNEDGNFYYFDDLFYLFKK